MLSCKLFNCLYDFADWLQGHEPIFPAEKSAAGVTVPRGLLPGYRSPLSLCVVVRKLGTEPPLPSCPGLDGRHGAGLSDIQLSEPRLALLQDACRIAPGPRPDVRGHRVKRPQRSMNVRFPLWSWRRVSSQTPLPSVERRNTTRLGKLAEEGFSGAVCVYSR